MSTTTTPSRIESVESHHLLKQIFDTRTVLDADGKSHPLGSNINLQEANELAAVIQAIRPTRSVEIGFAQGISALTILGELKVIGAGEHHVADPFQQQYSDIGIANVHRAGFEQLFTFHRAFAEDVVPQLGALDFGFIDASHLFDLTLCEFVLVDKKLKVGGVVGFHDMWMPAVRAVVRFILRNRSYKVFPISSTEKSASVPNNRRELQRRFFKRLPRADSVFAAEFLEPLPEGAGGNIVFLQKTDTDARDWRHFCSF